MQIIQLRNCLTDEILHQHLQNTHFFQMHIDPYLLPYAKNQFYIYCDSKCERQNNILEDEILYDI